MSLFLFFKPKSNMFFFFHRKQTKRDLKYRHDLNSSGSYPLFTSSTSASICFYYYYFIYSLKEVVL